MCTGDCRSQQIIDVTSWFDASLHRWWGSLQHIWGSSKTFLQGWKHLIRNLTYKLLRRSILIKHCLMNEINTNGVYQLLLLYNSINANHICDCWTPSSMPTTLRLDTINKFILHIHIIHMFYTTQSNLQ